MMCIKDALCSCSPCIQQQKDERPAVIPPSEPYYTPHSWELPEYVVPFDLPRSGTPVEEEDSLEPWSYQDTVACYAEWARDQSKRECLCGPVEPTGFETSCGLVGCQYFDFSDPAYQCTCWDARCLYATKPGFCPSNTIACGGRIPPRRQ